jgi:hypothetical protein
VQYPHDGGVSAIRFYFGNRRHALARTAADAITVGFCDAGDLVCQCGAPPDSWSAHVTERWATLICSCNGSSLPLYIGPPPRMSVADASSVGCPTCAESRHAVAIAIGYAAPVPALGSLDAERAQEIVVALRCAGCRAEHIGWRLLLPEPYPVNSDDDWLAAIQGRFR